MGLYYKAIRGVRGVRWQNMSEGVVVLKLTMDQEVGGSNLPSCTNPSNASEISKLAGIAPMKKHRLLLSVALVLGTCSVATAGCPNLPTAWVDPGGRPLPVYVYENAVRTCRIAAEIFPQQSGRHTSSLA